MNSVAAAFTPEASGGSYAPRNALNAEEIKRAIAARSQARGDSPEVSAWLLNHFLRHAIANFEPARVIETLAQALAVGGAPGAASGVKPEAPTGMAANMPANMPDWVVRRFDPQRAKLNAALAPVVWVDPVDPGLLALEARLVEFLGARAKSTLAGKLERITCPQALALWEREHAEMAARIERGWRQSQPEALQDLLITANGRFVELRPDSPHLRAEMAFESYIMRHCLGQFTDRVRLTGGYGEHYAEAAEKRRMRLLSFRDPQGQPHITLSLLVRDDGPLTVEQVKGKQNRPPIPRYVDDVIACLNHLNTDAQTPADCIAIGVVRTEQGWRHIEEVSDPAQQTRLVARHPALYGRLAAPTLMTQWLVAARAQNMLNGQETSTALRYALGARAAPDAEIPAPYKIEDISWPGLSAI